MRSLSKPPNDPLVQQMNDAQWLWCYLNVIEDKKEEEKAWRDRLKYIGMFINPEAVQKVDKMENSNNNMDNLDEEENIENDYSYEEDDPIYVNNDFEEELKRATSENDEFIELPEGTYGDPSLSSNQFIELMKDNIDLFGDLQSNLDKNVQLEEEIQNKDLDIFEINN